MASNNGSSRRAEKRASAIERQSVYNDLSIAQRIAELDRGGYAAKRQRARLAEQSTKASVDKPKKGK
jgi:hypothetical protein